MQLFKKKLDQARQHYIMMDDIIKIVKYLDESGLMIKCVSETIKNEAKEQKDGFF